MQIKLLCCVYFFVSILYLLYCIALHCIVKENYILWLRLDVFIFVCKKLRCRFGISVTSISKKTALNYKKISDVL